MDAVVYNQVLREAIYCLVSTAHERFIHVPTRHSLSFPPEPRYCCYRWALPADPEDPNHVTTTCSFLSTKIHTESAGIYRIVSNVSEPQDTDRVTYGIGMKATAQNPIMELPHAMPRSCVVRVLGEG